MNIDEKQILFVDDDEEMLSWFNDIILSMVRKVQGTKLSRATSYNIVSGHALPHSGHPCKYTLLDKIRDQTRFIIL